MANQEHLNSLRQGVYRWNSLRKRGRIESPDLKKADLSGADLIGYDLSFTDFSGADLSEADFRGAKLFRANLREANLNEADLSEADLSGADFSGADLCNANLSDTNIKETNFSGAGLSDADLSGTEYSSEDSISDEFSEWPFNDKDVNGVGPSEEDDNSGPFRDKNLSGADLSEKYLSGEDFSGADLSNANLSEADLSKANLREANLIGADLFDANLSNTDLSDADLSNADLSYANLKEANLYGADLSGADLRGADLTDTNLNRAVFRGTDLREADLDGANLNGTDLGNADLSRADLRGTTIIDANFRNSYITAADFYEAVISGTDLSGADIVRADLIDVDLSGGACLQGANLKRADLSGADLSNTVLRKANLSGANLSGANLTGANLIDANLSDADLSNSDLTGADLLDANLNDANLNDANLSGTNLTGTDLEESELKQTPQKIVYEFESGFHSIDNIAMDYITMAIDNSYPEYNLKLESLTLCGQPKAIFTVAGKGFVEQAKTLIDSLFEIQRKKIGVIVDEIVESITKTLGNPDKNSVKDEKADVKEASIDLKFACKKCGSSILGYDSYWKECTCEKCGWIYADVNLPREKNKPVEIRKEPKPNRSQSRPYDPVFSFSRLNLFEKCPMAYKFKYFLKKEEAFSTIEQHLGKCIHKSLEYAYNEMNDRGIPSKNSVLGSYNEAWSATNLKTIKVVKSNLSANYYKSEGADMLNSFFDQILSNDKSETVELEKYFEIEINSSIGFRGIIDRISKSSNKVLRITDFKTGKRVGNPATEKQLQFYSLWVFDTFKENKIEVCFEDLRNVETKIAEISRDRIPRIKENLFKDINRVNAEQDFEPNPSILCSWCGYNLICDDALSFGAYPGKATWNNGEDDTGEDCPRCGAELEERHGRYGTFIGCAEYPDCRYTRDEW